MRRYLGLLLPLAALACAAEAFAFLPAGRSPVARSVSRQESSVVGPQRQELAQQRRRQQARRMAAPSMMAAGGAKKKVLILGGDG